MKRASDDPLTDSIIALILAYMDDDSIDMSLLVAVSRVAASIIEEEVKNASSLLSLEVSIDPNALAQEWIKMMPSRISGINNTTASAIKKLLQEAIARGDTIIEVAHDLADMFGQINKGRAIMIARTEVLGATNYASWKTYVIANVPYKRWLATMDDRVRDSHAEANGQIRGTNEAFDIGGSAMMYPGDPNGPPGEVINCRCTIIPELKARTIWTIGRVRHLWNTYIKRAFAYETQMESAVRDQFTKQYRDILDILNRHGQ